MRFPCAGLFEWFRARRAERSRRMTRPTKRDRILDLDYGLLPENYLVYAHGGRWWRVDGPQSSAYGVTDDAKGQAVRVLGSLRHKLATGPIVLDGFAMPEAALCQGCGFGCPLGDRMTRELAVLHEAGVSG